MKKIFFLLIGITFSQLTIAQNPYLDYKYSFRINNVSTLFNRNTPVFVTYLRDLSVPAGTRNSVGFRLFHPTVSFDWLSKRKNTHELELIDLILNRTNTKQYLYDSMATTFTKTTEKSLETSISLKYEYKINFNTNKESRWVPSLGFSFNAYYRNYNTSMRNSLSYNTGVRAIGIRAAFNPSVTYFFSKRLYMTAGLSFTMVDFSRTTYLNPAYIQQSGQTDKRIQYGLNLLKDMLEFKIGIGYKF